MNSTAYTPLETLLLFHNLSAHGTHPSSFSLISQLLLKNPVIKAETTFDRTRLSPDALRNFFHARLKEAEAEFAPGEGQFNGDGRLGSPTALRKPKAKTAATVLSDAGKLRLVQALTSRLYERYRKFALQQIQEFEGRYQQLSQEIGDISEGKWDEHLLREEQARTEGRSKSWALFNFHERSTTPASERRIGVLVNSTGESSSLVPVSGEMAPLLTQSPAPTLIMTSPTSLPITSQVCLPDRITTPIKPERTAPVISSAAVLPQQIGPPQFNNHLQVHPTTPQARYEHMQPGQSSGAGEALGSQPVFSPQRSPAHTVMSPSSRQASIPKILPGPLPVPPKMEAVPPPPHPNTSLPVAPPTARPQGTKIEAPVPPPTRLPYPPITPRTPGQPTWSATQVPGQPIQIASQQVQGSPQGTGLYHLPEMTDPRWKQKHTPQRPTYPRYAPAGYPDRIQSVTCAPSSAGPALGPGASYGILYPVQTPGTPTSVQQQYPQTQPRPIAAAPATVFQQYAPTPVTSVQQSRQSAQASVVSQGSPASQKIAPRPTLIAPYASPRKAPPPPINTGASTLTSSTPIQPAGNGEEEIAVPGSPIPPRPDEISPISTPGGSPTVELPKPIFVGEARGRKRLFAENESGEANQGDKGEAPADKSPDSRPALKKQRSSKADKGVAGKQQGRARVTRSASAEPPARVTRSASAEAETRPPGSPGAEAPPASMRKSTKTAISPISEGSEVKDEEFSGVDNDDVVLVSPTSPTPTRKGKEVEGKKIGPTRATRKASASSRKADTEATERGETVAETPKTKNPKRKRNRSPSDGEEETKEKATTASPRKPFNRPPKLEPQSSSVITGIGSPLPMGVAVGQQQMVVATKKFLQLSAPLLGDISSHKFANLFMNPVNERMAPGYRNLVYKPEDLKSIKAAVKAGAAAVTNASTGTPSITTPTTETIAASTPPAHTSSTFTTLPATTLNTPPKGIVNSVQLEKELFRMFANAIMYNKSTSEIAKETFLMARDVEGMVDNFRTAEEAGMKKALGASFGAARKSTGGGERSRGERERTVGTAEEEGGEGGEVEAEGSTVIEGSVAGEGTEKDADDGLSEDKGGKKGGRKKKGRR